MGAATMATMLNNKVLLTIRFKIANSDLIGNYYFGFYGNTKKKMTHCTTNIMVIDTSCGHSLSESPFIKLVSR